MLSDAKKEKGCTKKSYNNTLYPKYAELYVTSNFSFLRGASHPDELVSQAHTIGLKAIGLTDLNSLAGVVRAHARAKELGMQFLVGSRLEVLAPKTTSNKFSILAYPTNLAAYGQLSRLLSLGKSRAKKGDCHLEFEDLIAALPELALILIPPAFCPHQKPITDKQQQNFRNFSAELRSCMPNEDLLSLALVRDYGNRNELHCSAALEICQKLKIAPVATNNVHFHIQERKPVCDVLACIRTTSTIHSAGFLLQQHSEAFIKPAHEMLRLFRDIPNAIARSLEIASWASNFSLSQVRYEYPNSICPTNQSPTQYLIDLTWKKSKERFPDGLPDKVKKLLEDELKLIQELKYEKYFLTCFDIITFARSKGILCQGRGAAANSAVCYCLGITSVDPNKIDLLFARFVSKSRDEPPDIDIDFEHERREEVIQYIYDKYGREHAALAAEVVTYRQRSAIRETAKAFGFSLEVANSLAKAIHRWTKCQLPASELQAMGLNPADPNLHNAMRISHELLGFPRHLSQHVGGFIISEAPLCELVPITKAAMPNRTHIEWDKDDIEVLGMLKIDVLALGMLSCIRKALALVNERRLPSSKTALELHSIPPEDPAVYDMLCNADTIGVFQIESRAQMSMLPRLRPRCFYDLVIEVAIVRPGPIQGKMVHPFLKRRSGLEKPHYPDQRAVEVLGKTLGVPLFQEQAMRLAIVLANFSPDEAEQLRRAMAAWKRDKGKLATFQARIIKGMLSNGYSQQFAENCVQQIRGFSEYGFPESHAASFALLVYASSWLKLHYPAEFAASLLNSQPMGFYAASQIVRDAAAHKVTILPVDVSYSSWDCTIENEALRLGLRMISGLNKSQAQFLSSISLQTEPTSISELWNKLRSQGQISKSTLQMLAKADAFQSYGLNSRAAIWEIKALPSEPLPIDNLIKPLPETHSIPALPQMNGQQVMFQDYQTTGLSLRGHPIGFIREYLNSRSVSTTSSLREQKRRDRPVVNVAGIAFVRQRPGTANGVVFITLEDESGMINLIIRPEVFEKYHKIIISSSCIFASGRLDYVGTVLYVNTQYVESLDNIALQSEAANLPNRSYSY